MTSTTTTIDQSPSFVKPAKAPQPGRFELSTWDQTFPCLFTPRFHCFHLKDDTDSKEIFGRLEKSLARAIAEWPDLCGTAVEEDADRGTCALVVEKNASVELKTCDFRNSGSSPWTFEEFAAKGFPPTMLVGGRLANFSRGVQPLPCPVFRAQVSIVPGGLIVAMGFLHRVVDGEIMRGFKRSWSKHCRSLGESREAPIEEAPSFDRTLLSQGLPGAKLADFPHARLAETLDWRTGGPDVGNVVSPIWRISKEAQQELKKAASSQSTNDALCCCLWLAVGKARRIQERGFSSSNMTLGVNIRPRLDPPLNDYMGNATYPISLTVPIKEYAKTNLATASQKFRQALDNFKGETFRKLIHCINDLPSVKTLVPGLHLHGGPDFFITTHAHFGEFDSSWGGDLGIPAAVRVLPVPAEGFCVIFSRYPDGSLELLTSLGESVFDLLKEDKDFTQYFSLVCA